MSLYLAGSALVIVVATGWQYWRTRTLNRRSEEARKERRESSAKAAELARAKGNRFSTPEETMPDEPLR